MQDLFPFINFLFNVMVAGLCGTLIANSMQRRGRLPVFWLHPLFAMGASGLMIVATIHPMGNPGLMAAGTAIGVGLICAGIILRTPKLAIGIRSAASIWMSAIAGLLIGESLFLEGAIIAILAYFILALSPGETS